MNRLRRWLLDRAELSLADAEHYKALWVDGCCPKPSLVRAAQRRIDRRRRLVEWLSGPSEREGEGE